MQALADQRRATGRKRQSHPVERPWRRNVDVHQLNITYYSALDADDERYLAARAIQLFAPGVPQIYYVGLLAGANDHAAVQATGEGRAINRHDYSVTANWRPRSGGPLSSDCWTSSGCGGLTRRFGVDSR